RPAGALGEHDSLKLRWGRARRLVPPIAGRLISDIPTYEAGELRSAVQASILTSGLQEGGAAASCAVLFGSYPPHDEAELRTRPGLEGPTTSWRLISGPEVRPPLPDRSRQDL